MLKLLKYEWKACARACLPIYGGIIVVALINLLLSVAGLENVMGGMPQMIAAFAYFGVMVAVFVVTAIILIQRFYSSLLGDEGYLMFTLPVTVGQHIWAKCIIAFVMSVLSGLAALASVIVLMLEDIRFSYFGEFFSDLASLIGARPEIIGYALELFVFLVALAFCGILFLYLCIALGHLAKKHRVAMSVIWFFVLSTVLEVLFSMFLVSVDGSGLMHQMFGWVTNLSETAAGHAVMLLMIVGAAVPTAAFFLGTRYILKNKLNLE